MKIQRFNEKKLNPKDWTFGKFDDIIKLEDEINRLEIEHNKYIKELNYYIVEYLKLHPEFSDGYILGKETKVDRIYRSPLNYPTYYIDIEYWLHKPYDKYNLESTALTKENIEDLLEFIKNPESYKAAKKYNL